MEPKLTAQQISVMRTLAYGKNVTNEKQARIIREIDAQAPGLVVIASQIGPARTKPRFGAVLSREGRRYLAALDAPDRAKK